MERFGLDLGCDPWFLAGKGHGVTDHGDVHRRRIKAWGKRFDVYGVLVVVQIDEGILARGVAR